MSRAPRTMTLPAFVEELLPGGGYHLSNNSRRSSLHALSLATCWCPTPRCRSARAVSPPGKGGAVEAQFGHKRGSPPTAAAGRQETAENCGGQGGYGGKSGGNSGGTEGGGGQGGAAAAAEAVARCRRLRLRRFLGCLTASMRLAATQMLAATTRAQRKAGDISDTAAAGRRFWRRRR